MAQADLVVLVFDLSVPWTAADDVLLADWPEAMVVHNKSDAALSGETARPPGLACRALTRHGLDVLIEQIGHRLVPHPPPPGAAVPFTEEQVATLREMEEKEVRS